MMNKKRLGIYLHIPFCVKKCNYCDFPSFSGCGRIEQENYIKDLVDEMKRRESLVSDYQVDTIFIGGGTPTCLEKSLMENVMNTLYQTFSICEDSEVSMECNPGTVNKEDFLFYKSLGINRLSIGLQSANDKELRALGRIHTFDKFKQCYDWAREAGCHNINIDLMSGIPGQTKESYENTCQEVIACKPEHISAYSLIVEEGTPFGEMYQDKPPIDEETDRQMYHFTKEFFHQQGYDRYEISNYAKKGYECQHNLKYWDLRPYLGVGLSAASYLEGVRYYNAKSFTEYHQGVVTKEISSQKNQMEEYIFLGLRKTRGFSTSTFLTKFGVDVDNIYGNLCDKLVKQGLLKREDEQIMLTDWGMDVSNQVMSQFLLDESE